MVSKKTRSIIFFIGLFLAGVILIVIGVGFYFSNEKKKIETDRKDELKSIATLKIKEISTWFTDERHDAQIIANDKYFIGRVDNWISSQTLTSENELKAKLYQLTLEHGYQSVAISTVDFAHLISSDEMQKHIDSTVINISKKVLDIKTALSTDLYRCPIYDKIFIDFIALVLNETGKPVAFAIFKHDPENFLFPLLKNWPVPSRTSETLILRKEGKNVLFLNDHRHISNTALKLNVPLTEKNVPAVFAANGNVGFIDGFDYRKKRVLAYADSIPNTPWFFVAKIDHDELFNNLFSKSASPIIVSFILILMFLLIFYFSHINQQKNSFKKLYKSNQEFKTTLYSIGDAVITTNNSGIVQYLNPIAEKLTGWTEDEASGKFIGEVFVIINEKTRERVENPVELVIKKGSIVGLANHTLLISKQGEEIPISDSGAPIFDENGKISGVVLVFRDQTSERRRQNEIIEVQRKMSTLLSNLPGMAYRCRNDEDWTMEFVSKGCVDLTGYDQIELENNQLVSFGNIIHPDDQHEIWERVQSDLIEHTFFQLEYRIITKRGDVKWVWEKGQGIYDERGNFVYIEGFITDITERKKAEKALQASEHLFQTLAENATVGIFRTDPYGLTTYINPAWCNLAGIEAEQALKDGWLEQVHPDDRESLLVGWQEAFSTKSISNAEYRFIHPDGKIIYVKGQAVPELNTQGELLGYIGTITDITESIQASDTLVNTNKILRTVIENIPDGIYMKDMEGRKIIANKADVENCGFNSEDELIGKSDFDIFPVEIASKFWEDDCKVLQKGIPVLNREEKLINLKNKVKWLFSSKIPFFDSSGKIAGLVGIGRDITRRKRDEDEMLKLTKAISQSPVSIVITDIAGNIEYVNPKFSEITGYTFEEAIGKNPRILKSGTQSPEFYSEMWKSILSGNDWKSEFRNKKKNGELFWENVNISPVLNDKGEIINFIAIKEDITEKKKILEELINAKERAEESDRLKSSFLANMSHEIRTPLNSILGFSNFLTSEDDLTNEEKKEYSNIINKSAEGLLQIINDIIDISSLETGQLKTFFAHLQVNSILRSLHTVFSLKLIEINKSHLFLTLLENEELTIYADENRFIQVITNLLNNALKFTVRGEISFGIESFNEEKVYFIVSDTGIGIRSEVQATIFERFRQGEENTNRTFGGNGLGLSIVKNLVELMGGEISLESEVGRGSKFRFWLPRKANNHNES